MSITVYTFEFNHEILFWKLDKIQQQVFLWNFIILYYDRTSAAMNLLKLMKELSFKSHHATIQVFVNVSVITSTLARNIIL